MSQKLFSNSFGGDGFSPLTNLEEKKQTISSGKKTEEEDFNAPFKKKAVVPETTEPTENKKGKGTYFSPYSC